MAEHDEPEDAPRRSADEAVRALMAAVANDIAAAVGPLRDEIDALKAEHAADVTTFNERIAEQDSRIAALSGRLRDLERGPTSEP